MCEVELSAMRQLPASLGEHLGATPDRETRHDAGDGHCQSKCTAAPIRLNAFLAVR